MVKKKKFRLAFIVIAFFLVLVASASRLAMANSRPVIAEDLDPGTKFYVPPQNPVARQHMEDLRRSGNETDAELIDQMINTPTAIWFTTGTPDFVEDHVRRTVERAAGLDTVPILVPYNIPFRDCSQYSAGGAASVRKYKAWIKSFAAGIGSHRALVILEPDSLGLIPFYNPFGSADTWLAEPNELGWCQPRGASRVRAAAERFEMLNYAVDMFKERPGARVYLDGTNSTWLSVGDAAHRLVQAGVGRADGFFLNVANPRLNSHLEKYGTWISKCILYATHPESPGLGHFERCDGKWGEAEDITAWSQVDDWYIANIESQPWYSPGLLKRFVIDTSRNGQGPWIPTRKYPDPQEWCNPPGLGVGIRSTANTQVPLLDAYLWIKIPGDSDGECTRGLGRAGKTVDPEWGRVDPVSGAWFPEMALELAHNANPPLLSDP